MASPKSSRLSSSRGDRSSRPRDPSPRFKEVVTSLRSTLEGHRWVTSTTRRELDSMRYCYGISDSVVLGLPEQHRGAIDMRGLAVSVALYLAMFSMGLCLPFCRPVCDVLDFLGLIPSQLVPNAWQILMACCVL